MSMMVPFPIRVRPNLDESLDSFLSRAAEALHYDKSYDFHKELGLLKNNNMQRKLLMFDDKIEMNSVSIKLNLPIEQLLSLSFLEENNQLGDEKILNFLAYKAFSKSNIRICPDCLNENRYYRKIWEINIVTSCPIHKRLLVDCCPKCAQKYSPFDIPLGVCSCGENICEAKIKNDDQIHYELETFIQLKVRGLIFDNSSPAMRLDLFSFINLVLRLGYCVKSYFFDKKKGFGFKEIKLENNAILHNVFEILDNWPVNFRHFLDRLKEIPKKFAAKSGFAHSFGNFYFSMYRFLHGEKYSFIRRSFEEYLYNNWTDALLGKSITKHISSSINSYFVSGIEAGRRLNVHIEKIKELIANKELEGVIVSKPSQNVIIVKTESIERFHRQRSQGVLKNTIRSALGISHRYTDELIESGIIRELDCQTVGNKIRRYVANDLSNLIELFEKNTHENRYLESANIVTFENMLRFIRFNKMKLSSVIDSIKKGELRIYFINNTTTLMKYGFFKLDLQNLFGRDDYNLSKAQVAKILNVPESYILNWILLGLLEATIVDNQKRVRISQESIKEFQIKYISLNEISKRKGIPSKKIVQLLKNQGSIP